MASCYSPWWKRILHHTPLFKLGPCENMHWRWHRYCYCRVGEHGGGFDGGIADMKTGEEIPALGTLRGDRFRGHR